MSSIKCKECGLVNFATEAKCKRCGTPLQSVGTQMPESTPGGSALVTEDGYVFPPPPSVGLHPSGVWRGRATLVMSKGAPLPDRCVKCNGPALGQCLKRRLSWHHPALYILIFVGLLVYFIVAMILRKTAIVEIGLCEEHLARRRRAILITSLIVSLGILAFVGAIMATDGTYALIGLLLLFGGAIYGIVAARTVVPAKIDDHYVWLKGVNDDYLNALPAWPV